MVVTKMAGAVLAPLPLTLAIMAGGLLLMLRWRRSGAGVFVLGFVLLLLASSEPVARAALLPLESRHPPVGDTAELAQIRWVVVLGASASETAAHPATTRLSGVAGLRLMEGLRLHRALPDSELILSGGAVFAGTPSATVMSRAALTLGAEPHRLRTHPGARNTREEMEQLEELLGEEPFLLVTSASHMPRAVTLARYAGLDPIPAPTAWRTTTGSASNDPRRFLPSGNALAMSERAVYEYLGLAWAHLRAYLP